MRVRTPLLALLILISSLATRSAWAARFGIVIVDEAMQGAEEGELQARAEALSQLMQTALGWKAKEVDARAFAGLKSGLAYIKKAKPAFALLSPHALAMLHMQEKITPVAHVIDRFGDQVPMRLMARRDSAAGPNLHQTPGMTLASAVEDDLQWLNVLFDGTIPTERHFTHLSVATMKDAVDAVVAKQADLALIDEEEFEAVEKRYHDRDAGLKVAYVPPPLPPRALVATRKARRMDTKKVITVAKGLCSAATRPLCSTLRLFSFEPGPHPKHAHLAYKYAHYK